MNLRSEPGLVRRILLLGGTSEIGLAVLAALDLPAGAEVILAGRDRQRLAAAGQELSSSVLTVSYDAADTGRHQAFTDEIFSAGPLDMVISAVGVLVPQAELAHYITELRTATAGFGTYSWRHERFEIAPERVAASVR